MLEIILTELTNRHPNDILAGSLESKRPINWLQILLAIIVTIELL